METQKLWVIEGTYPNLKVPIILNSVYETLNMAEYVLKHHMKPRGNDVTYRILEFERVAEPPKSEEK